MKDLLYIKSPRPQLREMQARMLDMLDEPEKSEQARMLRLGNAAMHYYLNTDPMEEDYNKWLAGLPENLRKDMATKCYDFCKTTLPLQRHALESRDVGIDGFMRGMLDEEDFAVWHKNCQ